VADDDGVAPDALADMEAHDTALADGIGPGDIPRTVGLGRQSGQVHVDLRHGAFRLDGDGEPATAWAR
jgi:hypothetical protein